MENSNLIMLLTILVTLAIIVCVWGQNTLENKFLQTILRRIIGVLFFGIILVGTLLIYNEYTQ